MNLPAFSHTADGRPRRHAAPIIADPAADDDDHDHTRTERIAIIRCPHGANAVFCAACTDHAAEATGRASPQDIAGADDADAEDEAIAEAFANANAELDAGEAYDWHLATQADRDEAAMGNDAEDTGTTTSAETFAAARRRRRRIADTESLDNPRLIIDDGPAPIPAWLRTIPDAVRDDTRGDCAPILFVLIICACITLVTLTLIALASFPS